MEACWAGKAVRDAADTRYEVRFGGTLPRRIRIAAHAAYASRVEVTGGTGGRRGDASDIGYVYRSRWALAYLIQLRIVYAAYAGGVMTVVGTRYTLGDSRTVYAAKARHVEESRVARDIGPDAAQRRRERAYGAIEWIIQAAVRRVIRRSIGAFGVIRLELTVDAAHARDKY
ncbi:hypothetical protein FACS18948_5010 [Clostridia bacterium]|nr:hypothetical protein FACS18948_5010 [Clostridia bacterium]